MIVCILSHACSLPSYSHLIVLFMSLSVTVLTLHKEVHGKQFLHCYGFYNTHSNFKRISGGFFQGVRVKNNLIPENPEKYNFSFLHL